MPPAARSSTFGDEPRPNHELGGARMGADPKTSVVNAWCQTHDVANLFVVDGSVFPSASEKNPTPHHDGAGRKNRGTRGSPFPERGTVNGRTSRHAEDHWGHWHHLRLSVCRGRTLRPAAGPGPSPPYAGPAGLHRAGPLFPAGGKWR